MGEVLNWFSQALSDVQTAFTLTGENMQNLITTLDEVQFSESYATRILGLVHYLAGDPLYLLFCTSVWVGGALVLYLFIRNLFNLVVGMIPGLKGRIKMG